MSNPAKIAVPVAGSALGALQAYFCPNDGGGQNYTGSAARRSNALFKKGNTTLSPAARVKALQRGGRRPVERDPDDPAVPGAAPGAGAPDGPELTTFAAHYRDPSTAPTLTVVGGPDRAPSCSSTSPTSRLGSDRSTCPWRGSNRRGDPIDRVGVSCGLAESGLQLAGERCQQVIAASAGCGSRGR
jgi:hypothetical protein